MIILLLALGTMFLLRYQLMMLLGHIYVRHITGQPSAQALHAEQVGYVQVARMPAYRTTTIRTRRAA